MSNAYLVQVLRLMSFRPTSNPKNLPTQIMVELKTKTPAISNFGMRGPSWLISSL